MSEKRLRLRDNYGPTGLGFILIVLTVLVVVGSLVGLVAFFGGRESCENKAEAMEREWRFKMLGGCLVMADDGSFVPLDNYRLTNEEAE